MDAGAFLGACFFFNNLVNLVTFIEKLAKRTISPVSFTSSLTEQYMMLYADVCQQPRIADQSILTHIERVTDTFFDTAVW
jgi:hypothetical protein